MRFQQGVCHRRRASRRVLALAAGLVAAVAAVAVVITVSVANSGTVRWTLVWGGDFAGPAGQAPRSWQLDVGQGIFGDGDIAALTSSPGNVSLDGHGDLDITAVGQAQSWTSARIQTGGSGFAAPAGAE